MYTEKKNLLRRVRLFLTQPGVRGQVVRVLIRRVCWKVRWSMRPQTPLVLRNWWGGLEIVLRRSGNARQIYCCGFSDPPVAEWMIAWMKPGMTMLDVGAHLGEYAMIAARVVGPSGRVHAIEPQPDLAALIESNAHRNGLDWVQVHAYALGEKSGKAIFDRDVRTSGGWLSTKPGRERLEVEVTTLDQFCADQKLDRVDLIKLDAGANEGPALKGAAKLLRSNPAPVILVKIYHPDIYRERMAYEGHEITDTLREAGYELFVPREGRLCPFDGVIEQVTVLVVATKDGARLADSSNPRAG